MKYFNDYIFQHFSFICRITIYSSACRQAVYYFENFIENDFFYCLVDNDNGTSLLFWQGPHSCSRFSVSKRTKYGRGENIYPTIHGLYWFDTSGRVNIDWLIRRCTATQTFLGSSTSSRLGLMSGCMGRIWGSLNFIYIHIGDTLCRSTNSHKIHVARCSSSDI